MVTKEFMAKIFLPVSFDCVLKSAGNSLSMVNGAGEFACFTAFADLMRQGFFTRLTVRLPGFSLFTSAGCLS